MKNLKRFSVVFFCVLLFNCSSQDEIRDVQSTNVAQLPNVISILEKMEKQKNLSSKSSFDFYFTSESDFVSGSNGCFTVNVRVYIISTITSQKTLLVSENVKVGDCPPQKTQTTNKNECSSFMLKNGDIFFSDGVKAHFCMQELIKYSTIYDNYINSVNSLLKLKR